VALGPRWVRAGRVQYGHQRWLAVTNGSEEPQVASRPTHAAGDHVRLMVWLNEVMGTSILRMDTAWLSLVPMSHDEASTQSTN
jgi:hypothetical protein